MTVPTPSAADTQSGSQASNSTSWTLTHPTNAAVGDLLLYFMATDGGSVTWTGGGTSALTSISEGSASGHARYLIATGSESGTFTATVSASEQGVWRAIRIPAATWWGSATDFVSTDAGTTGSGTAPDAGAAAFPGGWGSTDGLRIIWAGSDHGNTTYTGFPTGFFQEDLSTSGGHAQESGGANGAGMGISYKAGTSAEGSVDPSAFTTDASEGWWARHIQIRGAVSAFVPRHGFVNYQDPGVF